MTHRILTLVASLSLVPACFNPEDPGPFDEPAGSSGEAGDESVGEADDEDEPAEGEDAPEEPSACFELEAPCERGLDCCNYDPDFPPGSTQCVQVDEAPACTTICLDPDDCASGCCAALQGVEDYGACVDASICAGS